MIACNVKTLNNSSSERFLGFKDYAYVINELCKQNDWEFEGFRDHVLFSDECFGLADRQELRRALEDRTLSVRLVYEYAESYTP